VTHLDCLNLHLSNERIRLSRASSDGERELRAVFVAQLEKEVAGEVSFLGITADKLSEDELTAALLA
jgi:hypothetical protein